MRLQLDLRIEACWALHLPDDAEAVLEAFVSSEAERGEEGEVEGGGGGDVSSASRTLPDALVIAFAKLTARFPSGVSMRRQFRAPMRSSIVCGTGSKIAKSTKNSGCLWASSDV